MKREFTDVIILFLVNNSLDLVSCLKLWKVEDGEKTFWVKEGMAEKL